MIIIFRAFKNGRIDARSVRREFWTMRRLIETIGILRVTRSIFIIKKSIRKIAEASREDCTHGNVLTYDLRNLANTNIHLPGVGRIVIIIIRH